MRLPTMHVLHARTLRARFARAFGALLALATLNMGAYYWGARQRTRVFNVLHASIGRHSALTEARTELEDHYKRVKVVSDLMGVEGMSATTAERQGTVRAINGIRDRLAEVAATAAADHDDDLVDSGLADALIPGVKARVDSLTASWTRFYLMQARDPAVAISEVAVTAEPLAQRLLGTDLPAAIRAQHRRVDLASAEFVRTDRASSAVMWAILALSGLCGFALSYVLSRDLLGAIGALKVGVDRFGAGELAYRVAVRKCEELHEVGESLNAMAGRLAQARLDLEARNQELAHLAFRDSLTLLANRALFRDRVERALGQPDGPQDVFVLFIDLDDFKSINDTLGHASGDRLLVDVASRLLNATRGIDTVARLGGDEFAILLGQVHDVHDAVLVAERVIAAMRTPFALGTRLVHVGASVGIASGRDGADAEELLRNADVAMYRAKASGKGRHTVFEPAMHAALLDRVELEAELRDALRREELTVSYQPIVELATGRVTGFEALARWTHARRGIVPPGVFVPLAEETGAILPLGRWVLARACSEAVRWRADAPDAPPVGVSVNVSGRQVEDPSFVDDLRAVLTATGLEPSSLTLEITESVIMRDSETTLRFLREVKSLGVRVAIDDFGTGYSSLAYLQRFPVDVLKIDKAFVDQVAQGGNDAAIARTIVSLAETLGLRTVAEGIERPDQHAGLRLLGCQLGQGFHYARPLGAHDAAAFLRQRRGGEGVAEETTLRRRGGLRA
ncbi:diguanylate cyclase [Gemmatirosa kalamazoonensis]|uniref:Diguanylate cyclase n=1 Tax=Gemmatirosa kalamazoonensis TaxID=861299 RepID=W0RGD9_9BACT|nr:EAL domain-containing protein [Gemmatirosa kalamazoonensis]AHG88463.1 diguanylate cyclase [Gemmatirosa kalamazoonensis]